MAKKAPKRSTAAANEKPLGSKTTAMQRLGDMVRYGYILWVSGVVTQRQLRRLIVKFATKYGVDADKAERRRRRRQGAGNAVLVVYRHPRSRLIIWWLLCQPDHPTAPHHEQLMDATRRQGRLTVPDTRSVGSGWTADYELVHVDGTWTWRMTPACRARWVERIQATVREAEPASRHRGMRQIAHSLYTVPGYRGIRQQVRDLHRMIHVEWRRIRPAAEPLPVALRMPRYTRRRRQR